MEKVLKGKLVYSDSSKDHHLDFITDEVSDISNFVHDKTTVWVIELNKGSDRAFIFCNPPGSSPIQNKIIWDCLTPEWTLPERTLVNNPPPEIEFAGNVLADNVMNNIMFSLDKNGLMLHASTASTKNVVRRNKTVQGVVVITTGDNIPMLWCNMATTNSGIIYNIFGTMF